ncbi:uncharacterized protein LOC134655291 [Cydia amplana]|uniref:uncharacterized protein LOC134655291 n=1 Tax=Cydia amplana TaxID=1869771 RepID=UPI002FE66100
MFRTAYQRGFLTVFYSCGSKPLELWEVHVENGHIARLLDPDIKSMVLDIRGNNVSTSYMICPTKNRILGITMPFMIMVVKNLKKYFTFEVTILDDTGTRRRFRVSNFQSTTQILPMSTAMPIGLADGWNQIQFNLSEFTRRAYNKSFVEVQRIKVNANIRLRRIYFADRLTPDEDLPAEYRIFLPLPNIRKKAGEGSKTNVIKAAPSRTSNVELPPAIPPEAVPVGETPAAVQAEVTPEPDATEVEAPAQEGEAAPEEVEAPVVESVPTDGEAAAEVQLESAAEVQPTSAEVQSEAATEAQPETAAEAQPETAAEAQPEAAAVQEPAVDAPAEAASAPEE